MQIPTSGGANPSPWAYVSLRVVALSVELRHEEDVGSGANSYSIHILLICRVEEVGAWSG